MYRISYLFLEHQELINLISSPEKCEKLNTKARQLKKLSSKLMKMFKKKKII